MISKVPGLPDSTEGESGFINGPRVHEFLQEMNREVLSKYDVMTVGETCDVTMEDAILFAGEDRGELNMVFQFELMGIDSGPTGKWEVAPWKLSEFKRITGKWQTDLEGKAWNSIYLNNHDQLLVILDFYEHPARFTLDPNDVSLAAVTAGLLISNYEVQDHLKDHQKDNQNIADIPL
ncbi:Oligo-1,6-glucosidase [compost metagenome]